MDFETRMVEWLLASKLIKKKALEEAARKAGQAEVPIEEILVGSGAVKRSDILRALSELTGVEAIDLSGIQVKASVAQMIPREMVDRFRLLCVKREDSKIVVAMADPTDSFAQEFVKMRTGHEVVPRVAYTGDLKAAIESAFSVKIAYIGKDTPMKSDAQRAEGDEPDEDNKPKFVVATRSHSPRASLVSREQVQKKADIRAIRLEGFGPSSAVTSVDSETGALRALVAIGRDLASTLDPDVLVRKLLQNAIDITRSEGASLILVEEGANMLYFKESLGPRSEEVKQLRFPLDEHSLAGYAIQNRVTMRVNDVTRDPRHNKSVDQAVDFTTRSVLCSPVTWHGEPLGVITAVNKRDAASFSDSDQEFMEILASQAAVALTNSVMMDRLRNFYTESVGILVDLLEVFDTISRDHLVDVARFSTTMGQHLGLSDPEIERLCYAGLLHDIGKIKVADPHDPRHAETGATMLERVRLFGDLLPLIRHHHECFDGSGFPDGLRGDQVPLLARVLAIAEAWVEGLSERGAENRGQFLTQMRQDFGTRFDPDLRPAFENTVAQI